MQYPNLHGESITCFRGELESELLPILRNKVFHVTTRSALSNIGKDGLLRNNKHGRFPYSFPTSERSYARIKGWVSLFDLRDTPEDEIDTALSNFYFLNPPSTRNNPVFLFISPSKYPELIPWTRARDDGALRQGLAFIPKVEAFYPGDISVMDISRVVSVTIQPETQPETT